VTMEEKEVRRPARKPWGGAPEDRPSYVTFARIELNDTSYCRLTYALN
jgi:hypothetical protein